MVREIKVSKNDANTIIRFGIEVENIWGVKVKKNAESLLERLCVYDKTKNIIHPIDDKYPTYSVIKQIADKKDIIFCEKCGKDILKKEFRNHMKIDHGVGM